ncbi:MAG TPA: DNA polymerase III subunit gamma/tau [Anaerolineales bacterium]
MSQALYRKYRPKAWDEVVGQEHVVRTLKNAIAADRIGHAYLFAGPRGTGKTTLARILAKAVNCLAAEVTARPCNQCDHCRAINEYRFLDLIEMDGASNNGVENIRELRDKIGFTPSQGRFRVYIIDEVHMLSSGAFNALLKTLEEPPAHAIFILATTEIDKIPATVLSRCQRHEFRRVPLDEIVANLRGIVTSEGWQADEEALVLIARQATGSIRDAQSLLDQLASAQSKITLEAAQPVLGTATSQAVLTIFDAIQKPSPAAAMDELRRLLDSGVDPRTLARQIIEYLRGLMLTQMGNAAQLEVTKEVREKMRGHAAAFSSGKVMGMLRAFNAAAADTRGGWQPSLGLELALAECLSAGSAGDSKAEHGSSGGNLGGSGPPRPEKRPVTPNNNSARVTETALPPNVLYQTAAVEPARALAGEIEHVENPSPTPIGSEVPSIDLSQVTTAWKEIRGALKRTHPAVDGLLNSCKPVEVQKDILILGFQSEAVRALMDRPENLQAASKAIETVVGKPVRIRCVVINARGKVPPNIPQDGMVATALNQGGKIVDVQE